MLAAALLLVILVPQPVYLQDKDDFGINKLISDVKKRFKLTSRDVSSIRPFLNNENKNVLSIYARFSGDEPEYSDRLWQQIVERRREFESDSRPKLIQRQKAALREARTRMERRILTYLIEDYVDFLGHVLNLDEWEFNDVEDLLVSESNQRCRLIKSHWTDPVLLQAEMEKISRETEAKMQKLLSAEQWRDYRSLTKPAEQIARSAQTPSATLVSRNIY